MTKSRMYLRGIRSPNHRQRSRCPTAGPVREDLWAPCTARRPASASANQRGTLAG